MDKTKLKHSWVEKTYATVILIIFGGIVLHAPFSVGFGVLFPEYDLLIKSWKEILMLLLIPVAIVIITKRKLWQTLAQDWIFRLIIAYAALHVLLVAFFYQGAAATAAGLAIDLRYILFFGLVYVLLTIAPSYRRLMLKIGIIGACIVVGFATLQLFLPPDILKHIGYSNDTIASYLTVDKNPDYVRVNSTLRGPNPLGAYAGMVLVFLAAALLSGKLRVRERLPGIAIGLLTLCSLVALWISYSRSALVGLITAVGVVMIAVYGRRMPRRIVVTVLLVGVLVVGGLFAARDTSFVSNVILHEDPAEGNEFNSNDGHFESLVDGTQRLVAQPFGAGVGSTGSASLYGEAPVIIENQYLFVAHETGWLGLGLFVTIFSLIMWRLWQQRKDWVALGVLASGIGLAVIGVLQPVWVDDTIAIIWWGLAGLALAKGGTHDRQSTK